MLLRDEPSRLLADAVDTEVAAWIDSQAHLYGPDGRRLVDEIAVC